MLTDEHRGKHPIQYPYIFIYKFKTFSKYFITPVFVIYKKVCTRLEATSDKVYQLLVHGRWFPPGTSASSTTKTGHHDIAEMLLKVALNTKVQIQFKIFC